MSSTDLFGFVSQMRIPHKVTFVLEDIYRVSVAFPIEKHLIDVLTFQARLFFRWGAPQGPLEEA